jgi:hypothetical protein
MAYAIVKNSIVTNLVEWDGVSEYRVDGDLILADDNAYIGGEYNGSFVAQTVEPDIRTYAERRESEYPPINDLVVAMWEGVVEERMASVTRLEGLRQAIKQKYPKE